MKTLEEILSYTELNGDCLEWTRCFNTDGYPRAAWKGSYNGKVHRIVYELFTGQDISGRVIRHKCDNPKCINPDHLESGSHQDNMRDRDDRGRHYKIITPEIVKDVKELLATTQLFQREIADLIGVKVSMVSCIKRGLYDDSGRYLGRQKRR